MTTPDQLRAARALKSISQAKLAEIVGVSTKTIKRAEGAAQPTPPDSTIAAIRTALEAAGVEFIAENGGGAGVRLRDRSDIK